MLTFLRKIRRRLIADNRFSKYLLYALGEIILVVIGILIALQVSNWNQERQFQKENAEYLVKLMLELDMNIERLDFIESHRDSMFPYHHYDAYLPNLQISVDYIMDGLTEERMLHILKYPRYNSSRFNLHHSVYEDMQSNGRLKSLGDDELQKSIERYYRRMTFEQEYIIQRHNRALSLWEDCKYGFNNLKVDFDEHGPEIIARHSWIFDADSKHYLDLKVALATGLEMSRRNKIRLEQLRGITRELIAQIQEHLE